MMRPIVPMYLAINWKTTELLAWAKSEEKVNRVLCEDKPENTNTVTICVTKQALRVILSTDKNCLIDMKELSFEWNTSVNPKMMIVTEIKSFADIADQIDRYITQQKTDMLLKAFPGSTVVESPVKLP